MKISPISDIHIASNRQRQEFDPTSLQELVESIRDNGLLHAPVCRISPEGTLYLVAGERRMKAIQDLWMTGGELRYNNEPIPEGSIPYVLLGELSEIEAEEAELAENIRRDDLTWQEEALAHKRLHELREKQVAIRNASLSKDDPAETWSVADTAREIFGRGDGGYQGTVRQELILANNLDDEEIAKAKSLKEGFKILKKREEIRRTSALADAIGLTFSAKSHKLFNADALKWMEVYGDGSFDVICTDPPYGMGADQFGDGGGKLAGITHKYDDSYESWKKLMEAWTALTIKVVKPEAHAYVFCDFDRFHELKEMMEKAGWYVFRTPLVCVKSGSGRVPLPEHGPRRQYELCLYAFRGKKPVLRIYPDVITTTADKNEGHGATKPVELFVNLLQRSCRPGDKVLDCFAGTGPIFPAAHFLKCTAVGIELASEYYGLALSRLQQLSEKEA